MDADNVVKFKALLKNSIKEVSSRIIDVNVDSDGDECDEMQAAVILDIAYAEKDRNTFRLNSLVDALNKLEGNSEDYGLCEECDEEIGFKRLEIFPDAKFCIKCAEKIEKETGKFR